MTYDPADKRALFQRVVDDIIDQIRAGTLNPGDKLPSAKEISDRWDVSSMTSQRALRELQALGISYGMAGKGTYVHPEAHDKIAILDGEPVQTPEGITISAELATHLQYRELFLAKPPNGWTPCCNATRPRPLSCKPRWAWSRPSWKASDANSPTRSPNTRPHSTRWQDRSLTRPPSRPPTTSHPNQPADAAPRNRPPSAPPGPAGYKVLH